MQKISTQVARAASCSIAHRQAARVTRRVAVSPELAGVIAGLAWGSRSRDHDVLLVAVTLDRTASAGAVQQ